MPFWLVTFFIFQFVYWLVGEHKSWQEALLFALVPTAVGYVAWQVIGWLLYRFWSRH